MILFELTQTEAHPAYQTLAIANGIRQYDFLRSMVVASLDVKRPFLSQSVIKALNYHAITCLHINAGEYRPCAVEVGNYEPPAHYRVQALMDEFVNSVNREWSKETDILALAAYVIWRINYIHPFINGNGRTARAAGYYVICVASGGWLPGDIILPELIKQRRSDYVEALRLADQSLRDGQLDLSILHKLLQELIEQQLKSADIAPS